MRRWIGIEVVEHRNDAEWHGHRYEPMPPFIYSKGYYCHWGKVWIFYPVPFSYVIRLWYHIKVNCL